MCVRSAAPWRACALLALMSGCGPEKPVLELEPQDPIALTRVHEDALFDDTTKPGLTTDGWRIVPFAIGRPLEMRVALLGADGRPRGSALQVGSLEPGTHVFVLSYDDVAQQLGAERDFSVELQATPRTGKSPAVRAVLPGYLREEMDNELLGRILERDVLIQRGEMRLRREDFEISGRGPQFDVIRNYSNVPLFYNERGGLGPGWSHNHDIRIHAVGWGDEAQPFNLPKWVADARGRFLAIEQVPTDDGPPRLLSVTNGGLFRRSGNRWTVQRSFHGSLLEERGSFIFRSIDGTRYAFDPPRRLPLAQRAKTRLRSALALGPAMPAPVRYIEDRNGNRMSYEYADTRDGPLVVQVTDAVKRTLRFAYDPPVPPPEPAPKSPGEAEAEVEPAEAAPAPPLEPRDGPERRLVKISGPDELELEFAYSADGTRQLETFKRDYFTERYRYEPQKDDAGTAPEGGPRPRHYNLVACIDAHGHETGYQYGLQKLPAGLAETLPGLQVADLVTAVTYVDGKSVRFFYGNEKTPNARGVQDGRGYTTWYTLNATGQAVEVTDAKGKVEHWRWTIDDKGADLLRAKLTDGEGRVFNYRYDRNGMEVEVRGANGPVREKAYDANYGLLLWARDGEGIREKNRYDSRGNLVEQERRTQKGNERAQYTYNAAGQQITSQYDGYMPVQISYDDYGNLKAMHVDASHKQDFEHDARGRRLSYRNWEGASSRWSYDTLDRVTRSVEPKEGSIRYKYDAKGLEIERTVGDRTIRTVYDERDRVKTRLCGDEVLEAYTYDANGNVLTEQKGAGVISHRWDPLNEEIK